MQRYWLKPLLVCVLWLVVLSMPLEVLHAIAVILHTLYEGIAYLIEKPLIHSAGLEKYQAQMLVFYGSCLVGFWALQRLVRRAIEYFAEIKAYFEELFLLIRSDFKLAIALFSKDSKLHWMLVNFLSVGLGLMLMLAS